MDIRRAFNLVELLVVVAIIALLAAILFPVFARTREKARQTTCVSNLKQIGLAFAQYNADYEGNYPCDTSDPFLWQGRHFRWPIMPYLGIGQQRAAGSSSATGASPAILLCPSDTSTAYDGTSYAYSAAFYLPPAQTAAVNSVACLYVSATPCGLTPAPQNEAQVVTPARKILCGEWADNHDGLSVGGWWSAMPSFRNFTFADGHVQYVSSGRMTPGADGFPDPNVTPGGIAGADVP